MRRQTPKINAGSMADIAFLLLIFWLVATTITPEYGISSILKNDDEEPKIAIVTESRNLLRVHVREDGGYEIEGEKITLEELETQSQALREGSGYRARIILTSDFYASYEDYAAVKEIVQRLNLKLIENEIKEEEREAGA